MAERDPWADFTEVRPDDAAPVDDWSAFREVPAAAQPAAPGGGLGRRFAMGVRDVLVGVPALPGLVYDLAGTGINAAARGVEAIGGPSVPRVRRASENLEAIADAASLPRPETREEQRVSAASRGVAGTIPTLAAGAALQGANAGAGAAPALAQLLVGNIPSQVVGGAASGVAGEVAAENGAGPWGQLGASLLGGVGGAAATQAAQAAGRGAAALFQPFTEGGRQRAVADVLLRGSADPENLAGRIAQGAADADARLPGSPVTTAQAARDPGLMVLESGARSQATPTGATGTSPAIALRDVDARRNAGRVAAIDALADGRTPETRGVAVRDALRNADDAMGARVDMAFDAARRQNVSRFSARPVLEEARAALRGYDPAQGGAGVPAELQGVVDDIARLGSVTLDQAQNLRARLGDIAGRASAAGDNRLASAAGSLSASLERTVDDPRWMAAVDLRRQQGEAVGRDAAGAAATGQVLATDRFGAPRLANGAVANRVLQSPDSTRQTMEAFYKALDDARRARLPVEQVEALSQQVTAARDALRGQFVENMFRASATGSDIADAAGSISRALSPAQFRRFWEQNAAVAREIFEPSQIRQLQRLGADFAETGLAARTASTGGSPTAQNLSVANLIARTSNGMIDPGMPAAQTIGSLGGVMRLLYSAPEEATRELLARAIANPEVAQQVLSQASPRAVQRATGYAQQNTLDRLQRAAAEAAGRVTLRAGTTEGAIEGLLGPAAEARRRRGLLN